MKGFLSSLLETVEVAVIAVVSVVIIRTFLVQPFMVSGDSMEPNLENGNYLLVDELSYQFRNPERGEVIVFRYPENPAVYYIKRIVGLPGEKVEVKGGEVKIFNPENTDGMILSENYLPKSFRTSGDVEMNLTDVQYFVMGDNRMYSYDSRSWGPLDKNLIIGLARFNLWPLNQAKAIAAPIY